MPTAERRRADAARAQVKTVPKVKAPPAPEAPPAVAPEAPAPEPAQDLTNVDPAAFRSLRQDPPFRHPADRMRQYGPFDLQMPDGAIHCGARWSHYSTTSGGRAWGWVLADGRAMAFNAVAAWRAPLAVAR